MSEKMTALEFALEQNRMLCRAAEIMEPLMDAHDADRSTVTVGVGVDYDIGMVAVGMLVNDMMTGPCSSDEQYALLTQAGEVLDRVHVELVRTMEPSAHLTEAMTLLVDVALLRKALCGPAKACSEANN